MEPLISLPKQIILLVLILFCSSALILQAQWTAPGSLEGETKEQYEQRMGWWEESRMGMFVCWGPVSLTGKEIGWARGAERNSWSGKGDVPVEIYDKLYRHWMPTHFNAREWVQTALDAGSKYMIFLVKHHDGFCLFDTEYSDYKSTATLALWQKDVFRDIADACHDMGLKLVVYFSLPDWHDTNAFTENHHKFIETIHGQVREIATNYGKIDGLWFDLGRVYEKETGEWRHDPKDWGAEELFQMLHELQPGIVINNRTNLEGDFGTPEQRLGGFEKEKNWEACVTLGTQWAWKPQDAIKSFRNVVYLLVQAAGGDGNLALNTNPMPDGRIEPRQVERFKELGHWLEQYGESIYGTRGGPFKPGTWGSSTHRGNKIYLHILNSMNDKGEITLPPLPGKIIQSRMLTAGTINTEQSPKGIYLTLSGIDENAVDQIVELELDGDAREIVPIDVPVHSYSYAKPVKQNGPAGSGWHSAEWAVDDDFASTWQSHDEESWLEIDLEKKEKISRVVIFESGNRIRKFKIDVKDGDDWLSLYEGTTVGEKMVISLQQVKTQNIRLQILESEEPAVISEILVF